MQFVVIFVLYFVCKVCFLFDYYGLVYDMVDVGNVVEFSEDKFVGNLLMLVLVFNDGDLMVYDSDYIVVYLVCKYDLADCYGVLIIDVWELNVCMVLNGMMLVEMCLLLGVWMGLNIENQLFFDKVWVVFIKGFDWFDVNIDFFNVEILCYFDFYLILFFDYMECYGFVMLDQLFFRVFWDKLWGYVSIVVLSLLELVVYV